MIIEQRTINAPTKETLGFVRFRLHRAFQFAFSLTLVSQLYNISHCQQKNSKRPKRNDDAYCVCLAVRFTNRLDNVNSEQSGILVMYGFQI